MESSCTRFTAAEGGARLAACAGSKNILVTEHTAFISTSVLIEHAHKIRGPLSNGWQRSVYLTRSSRTECVSHELTILTNLSVIRACSYADVADWKQELEEKEVLVCTSEVLQKILENHILTIPDINVLVVDSCHLIFKDQCLQYIMRLYKQCGENKPRILALTYPLFTAPKDKNEQSKGNLYVEDDKDINSEAKDGEDETDHNKNQCTDNETCVGENPESCDKQIDRVDGSKIGNRVSHDNMDDFNVYEKLEWKIEELERALCCDMDLAEDIDGGKRLSATLTKPKELIIEYSPKLPTEVLPGPYIELENYMRCTINEALDFIHEHRYDPTEIYGDDMYEEFANIPDPTADPKHILKEFLYVLDELGPYAADKAAFSLLIKLEKLKIKVPYERHFLLLCLCTTVLVKIRCYGDLLFSTFTSDWEKITSFSTPKVLRLAEILEQFQPPESLKETDLKNTPDSAKNISDSNEDIKVDSLDGDISEKSEKDNETTTTNANTCGKRSVVDDDKANISENIQNSTPNGCDSKNVNDSNNIDNKEMKRSKTAELLSAIDKCDFVTLGNKLEDRVNTYEANLKDLDDFDSQRVEDKVNSKRKGDCKLIDSGVNINGANGESSIKVIDGKYGDSTNTDSENINSNCVIADKDGKNDKDSVNSEESADKSSVNSVHSTNNDSGNIVDSANKDSDRNASDSLKLGFGKRTGHRNRGRGRVQRSNTTKIQQLQQNPDALCGIIFVKEALMAKIMFMMIVDMSRSRLSLSHLCAQYCASESTGEGRDCQREGKKQEDVLKKFRMHECNLLLATSVLEEGIDLPRCNLVVRWDVPPSYRSHGLCRGRARAPRASVALLASSEHRSQELVHNLAVYKELDQIITRKCGCGVQYEPPADEENHADSVAFVVRPYAPLKYEDNLTGYNDKKKCEEKCKKLKKTDFTDDDEQLDNNLREKETVDIIKAVACRSFNVLDVDNGVNSDLNSARNLIGSVNTEMVDNNFVLIDNNEVVEDIATDTHQISQCTDTKTPNIAVNLNRLSKREKDLLNATELLTKDFNTNLKIYNVSNYDDENHENDGNNEIIDELNEDYDKRGILLDGTDERETCSEMDSNSDELFEINKDKYENELKRDGKDKIETAEKQDGVSEMGDQLTGMTKDNNEHEFERDRIGRSDMHDKQDGNHKGGDKFIELNNDNNEHELERDGAGNSEMHDKQDGNHKGGDKFIELNNDNNEHELERDGAGNSEMHDKQDGNHKVGAKFTEIIDDSNEHELEKDGIYNSETDVRLIQEENVYNEYENGDNFVVNRGNTGKGYSKIGNENAIDVKKNLSHEQPNFRNDSGHVGDQNNVKYENMKLEYKMNDSKKTDENVASVDLNTAIALINRYCGKLPSDTFTRLAPQWWMEQVRLPDRRGDLRTAYICTLRMPLNCPVKYNIVGHPMPTRVLARRMVALQACRILHKSGELDNQLMPIGKENFKAAELDTHVTCSEPPDPSDCARPGTTKRRQYYFKRTAWAFTDCQAIIDAADSEIEANPTFDHPQGASRNILYAIVSRLWCALPERYNTRGRRLHAPQHAPQAIGVLMARREPTQLQIPAFPVYTRSGEVRVSVEPALAADVRLSPRRARLIRRFMRFVFSDVLRVRRRGMKLQMEGTTHNNYYIVPTIKKTKGDGSSHIDVDWPFLELIYKHTEEKKTLEIEKPIIWEEDEKKKEKEKDEKETKMENPLLKNGEVFAFDPERYKEAVVTPWYRNQDQPQFFLVAEICWKLSPDSAFPSAQHASFRSYYRAKYGAELTQSCQPLLDVDHTSARLNLLTPRYVNRKGVALPVSSERTRRAKRDRLDQKQILVPELCRVHPFAAPLWFATVALPCVLYRINALLIADEIRRAVAIDVGLGISRIDDESCPGFQWPALDFGWSLAEVLSADSEKIDKKKDEDQTNLDQTDEQSGGKEQRDDIESAEEKKGEEKEKTINDILQEKLEAESGFEIGTWSNDMASSIPQLEYDEFLEPLPSNLTFCTSSSGGANWSDKIEKPKGQFNPTRAYSMADSDCSYVSSDFDTDDSDLTDCSDDDTDTSGFCSSRNSNVAMGVRIEYKTAHEAEAVDLERRKPIAPAPQPDKLDDERDLAEYKYILRAGVPPKQYVCNFRKSVARHEKDIKENGHLIHNDKPIVDLLPEPSRDIDRQHNQPPPKNRIEKHKQDEDSKTAAIPNVQDRILKTIDKNHVTDIVTESIDKDKPIRDNNEALASQRFADKIKTIKHNRDNEFKTATIENEQDRLIEAFVGNVFSGNKKSIDNEIPICATNDIKDEGLICDNRAILKNSTNLTYEDRLSSASNDTIKSNSPSIDKKSDIDVYIRNDTEILKSQTRIEPNVNKNEEETNVKSDIGPTLSEDITKMNTIEDIFPYRNVTDLQNDQITLESIEKNKRCLLAELRKTLPEEEIRKMSCFSMIDVDIDAPEYVNEKIANFGFDSKEKYREKVNTWSDGKAYKPYYMDGSGQSGTDFDFDYQPDLQGHPGPSPSLILQALTMSNANDGINLERLETIGDSFLKFAITAYLYCAHPAVHEGKLSHMRSKQVSNLNLYRLGRNKRLGARMIASKFEPHDNWLPPCHKPPPTLQPSFATDAKEPLPSLDAPVDSAGCFIPYNLITQHSIPDKSIADCVEALIGAYLLECGPRGALLFMSWLGIRVLPRHVLPLPPTHPYVLRARTEKVEESRTVQRPPPSKPVEPISSDSCCSDDEEVDPELNAPEHDWSWRGRPVGALRPYQDRNGKWMQPIFGELKAPPSPLLRYIEDPEGELEQMLSGYDALERTLQYRFRDRSLLLQALTHASHQKNRLTDCYQRLEFLGDAILDYLITRHLYEDPRRHSPGALTDLRSALVNNTIFATLAARHGFHKYFRHMSPGLNEVLTKYVKIQEENGHSISEEHYLIQEDEMEQAEDVEVPKALGDLFESVAGAIFLDSGMSLGAVWRSVGGLLGAELDAFSAAAPKSPVRELLEAEPDTAKFGKPERLADGRRVRVCVEVFGRGAFKGIGRNYRIAKGTAARCALRHLRSHRPR